MGVCCMDIGRYICTVRGILNPYDCLMTTGYLNANHNFSSMITLCCDCKLGHNVQDVCGINLVFGYVSVSCEMLASVTHQ